MSRFAAMSEPVPSTARPRARSLIYWVGPSMWPQPSRHASDMNVRAGCGQKISLSKRRSRRCRLAGRAPRPEGASQDWEYRWVIVLDTHTWLWWIRGEAPDSITEIDCMSTTCRYPKVMAKMIQVRHVPDDVHRRLTDLARQSRTSLSDYLLAELERTSLRPSPKEILARLSKLRPVATRASIVSALREERDRH